MSNTSPEPVMLPGLAADEARAVVLDVLGGIAPGPALDALGPHDDLRDTLGMDSLDFLALVTRVVERSGRRIEEDDYPELARDPRWNYEDGVLAGMLAAQMALRAELRRRG